MDNWVGSGLAAVLAGACAVSYFFCGLYILPPAVRDKRIRPLLCLCAFCSLWCVTYVGYFLSTDAAADTWRRLTFAGFAYVGFPLWFFAKYLDLVRNRRLAAVFLCAIWVSPLLTAYQSVVENAVARDFPYGFWFLYTWIQTTVYNLACTGLVVLYHLKHRTNKSRAQTMILIPCAALCMVAAWISDYYFGLRGTQNISPLWLLIWVGALLYTIHRYRFIAVKPDFINKDITDNIDEGIVLLDLDLGVVFSSRAMLRLMGIDTASFPRLEDMVSEPQALDRELSALRGSGRVTTGLRTLLLQDGGGRLSVDIVIKKVTDTYGDATGFLLIFSTVKDMGYLRTRYGISRREMDVILQLTAGKTSKEISGLLRIAQRTVEAHVQNIYNKLGVSNRIELINVVSALERPAADCAAAEGRGPGRPPAFDRLSLHSRRHREQIE